MRIGYGSAFAIALVSTSLTVAAQSQPAPRPSPTPQATHPDTKVPETNKTTTQMKSAMNADEHFVMEAASGGMAEVELGKLAADKASSAKVKDFAQRMVTDHGKANDELKSLAAKKNITLPSSPDAKHKATYDRLSKLSGAAFDRAYIADMLADHQKDVAAFKKQSQTGKDADIKAWAAATLPTLEEHLKLVQSLNRQPTH
jgi:putative membrane protein